MDLFDCGNLDQMHLVLILYILHWTLNILHSRQRIKKEGTRPRFCQIMGIWRRIHFLSLFVSRDASKFDAHIYNAMTEEEREEDAFLLFVFVSKNASNFDGSIPQIRGGA